MTDFATQNLVNSGFAALDSPSERGSSSPSKVFPFPLTYMSRGRIQRLPVAFAAALGEGLAVEFHRNATETSAKQKHPPQLFQHIFVVRQNADFFARPTETERPETDPFHAVRQTNRREIATAEEGESADFRQPQFRRDLGETAAVAERSRAERANAARQT